MARALPHVIPPLAPLNRRGASGGFMGCPTAHTSHPAGTPGGLCACHGLFGKRSRTPAHPPLGQHRGRRALSAALVHAECVAHTVCTMGIYCEMFRGGRL